MITQGERHSCQETLRKWGVEVGLQRVGDENHENYNKFLRRLIETKNGSGLTEKLKEYRGGVNKLRPTRPSVSVNKVLLEIAMLIG